MAVRQFNRKRRAHTARKPQRAASRKGATRKLPVRRAPQSKPKVGQSSRFLPIPSFAGRRKPIDGREAAVTVLEATQSFAAALLDVENLMWTVHRGHAKAIRNLSTVARAVLRGATELKRTLR